MDGSAAAGGHIAKTKVPMALSARDIYIGGISCMKMLKSLRYFITTMWLRKAIAGSADLNLRKHSKQLPLYLEKIVNERL